MFKRIYVEITNVCNLSCEFCPKTKRKPKFMSANDFNTIAQKIRPYTDHIYLHVMGEPLLHPELKEILCIASDFNFKINITTNGTLLNEKKELLLNCPSIRKIAVSLHSFEGNHLSDLDTYLNNVWDYCSLSDQIIALRLWNGGGANTLNDRIISFLSDKICTDINTLQGKPGGKKLIKNIYLESADKFDWPDINSTTENDVYCHGLTMQIGVLCDGTVVPCCLDNNGTVNLGNLFENNLEDILSSPRAISLREGFSRRKPTEDLCRRCGYATRF